MAEAEPRPDDQLVINDLEALRIMSDPLRMRIIEILRRAPATVKDIAAILEAPPKSLYYHVNLLEKHGLIRVLDTRLVSGIVEKRYLASAYLFVYSDICSRRDDDGEEGAQVVISSIFSGTREELNDSIERGRITLAGEPVPPERALRWEWRLLKLRPEEAADLAARLKEVIEAHTPADGAPMEEGQQTYRVFSTLFPTYDRGTPAPLKRLEETQP